MPSFLDHVTHTFALGPHGQVTASEMRGSSNRLWRFSTPDGEYVVKEFPYDTQSDLEERKQAAAFEKRIFDSGDILMPEPIRSVSGDFICKLTGSRDQNIFVRVHRWMDGHLERSTDPIYLAKAGTTLYRIQQHGQEWSTESSGKLEWWDEDPLRVLDRALHSESKAALHNIDRSILIDALQLINEAEQMAGPWVFTHCDHKPENSLCVGTIPAIIDWDECGTCHPRLEAVEAALRWSGESTPNRLAFSAFLQGYSGAGGTITSLKDGDFAKWVAAIVGWFAFQTRRALGDWPQDTPAERADALRMSVDALASLQPTLAQLSIWSKWIP